MQTGCNGKARMGATNRVEFTELVTNLPCKFIRKSFRRDGRRDKHQLIDYAGQVHCVSVPNGIVYVRRNGRPFFSGNSMQRKLLSSTVDNVGRGVIIPQPDYDMDTVGLPEEHAFEVYKRFVARELKRRGMPMSEALKQIENKTPLARERRLWRGDGQATRPVYMKRAPVLHKFGIMAFRPKLVKGSAIQTSPLIVKGYGADYDGDCKSLSTIDLWIIDGKPIVGELRELVKLLDTSWPPATQYMAEIAENRLLVPSLSDGNVVFLPVSHVHFHTRHKAMYRVTLVNGHAVTVITDDHAMMTYGPDSAVGIKFQPVIYVPDP